MALQGKTIGPIGYVNLVKRIIISKCVFWRAKSDVVILNQVLQG